MQPAARNERKAPAAHPRWLAAIARTIATDELLWRHRLRHDPSHRYFVRLIHTETVEAWLLTWTTEQGIALHDHGGSAGVALVVEGELIEHATDLTSRRALREERWRRGTLHAFGPGHVHDLRNAGNAPAVSIHVYSPPLSSMTFYEHDPGRFLAPLRVEPVIEPVRKGFDPVPRVPTAGTTTVGALLTAARARLTRVEPRAAADLVAGGALLVDIRPSEQRRREGDIPGALVIERNVLEWRLDPASEHRLPEVDGYDRPIVLVCSEGYASSLAAAMLQNLGLRQATDLIGGFQAWVAAGLPVRQAPR